MNEEMSDAFLCSTAYGYRANLIETGSLTFSERDLLDRAAAEKNPRLEQGWLGRILRLDPEREESVRQMRDLASACMDRGWKPPSGGREGEWLSFGLECWANNVETGDPLLNRSDAMNRVRSLERSDPDRARSLTRAMSSSTPEKAAFVSRLRKLASEADGRVRRTSSPER
jgi:hypothetical protein